jgi:hypothetical protein
MRGPTYQFCAAMPFSLIPTVFLETILNEVTHPLAEEAIQELTHLKSVQSLLTAHVVAIQRQTAVTVAGLTTLKDSGEPRALSSRVDR